MWTLCVTCCVQVDVEVVCRLMWTLFVTCCMQVDVEVVCCVQADPYIEVVLGKKKLNSRDEYIPNTVDPVFGR